MKCKQRICEILNVEPGIPFTANYPNKKYFDLVIDKDGTIKEAYGGVNTNISGQVLCHIINHPECINEKHIFTGTEINDAKTISRLFPEKWNRIHREKSGALRILDEYDNEITLNYLSFPSIENQQVFRLSEIIGDD